MNKFIIILAVMTSQISLTAGAYCNNKVTNFKLICNAYKVPVKGVLVDIEVTYGQRHCSNGLGQTLTDISSELSLSETSTSFALNSTHSEDGSQLLGERNTNGETVISMKSENDDYDFYPSKINSDIFLSGDGNKIPQNIKVGITIKGHIVSSENLPAALVGPISIAHAFNQCIFSNLGKINILK